LPELYLDHFRFLDLLIFLIGATMFIWACKSKICYW